MAEVSRLGRATEGAAERARDVEFPIVLRGYDRQAVDAYVEEIARLLDELETTQLRESVVQRALDEVGEQTAGILQRAHETAEEITARSRAKAEGRLQRAEREAEMLRRDADEYAERLVADTRHLWDERQRLIEEMRQLADEVLGTADDAGERVPEPEMLRQRAAEAEEDATAVIAASEDGPAGEPFDLAEQEPQSFEDQPTDDFDQVPPAGDAPAQEALGDDAAEPPAQEALGEEPAAQEAFDEEPAAAQAQEPPGETQNGSAADEQTVEWLAPDTTDESAPDDPEPRRP